MDTLFILGAKRSGTTLMLRLCRDELGYAGGSEGHVWQSLQLLDAHFVRLFTEFGGEGEPGISDFSLTRFTRQEIMRRYADVLGDLHRVTYGNGSYVDKTPGIEQVQAVPLILDCLPNARFIFMKRRAIENVMSCLRRFPELSFRAACESWVGPMCKWLEIRNAIGRAAIEIDHRDLATAPDKVACRLVDFLSRGDAERLAQYIATHHPEKTLAGSGDTYLALSNSGWDATRRDMFREICGPTMADYGYEIDHGDGLAPPVDWIDLASPALASRCAIRNENPWISTRPPGIHLHPSPPGSAPPVLTLRGCLPPGKYSFEAEVVVFDARCSAQRITFRLLGQASPSSWSIDIEGGKAETVVWRKSSIEVVQTSDVEIEIALAPAVTHIRHSATQLVSAVFQPARDA